MGNDTEFRTLCGLPGRDNQKCDLHFVVENEISRNKRDMEEFKKDSKQDIHDIKDSLNNLIVDVKSNMKSQELRDEVQDELKKSYKQNTEDINDLKSKIVSISESQRSLIDTVDNIDRKIGDIGTSLKDIDKERINKEDVNDIVENIITRENNIRSNNFFNTLPGKISAFIGVLTFISYFVFEIMKLII